MKKQSFISWLKSPSSDCWLFIIVLVLLNLVASRAFLRFDLTGPRSYSLSKASKEIVRTVEEPLSIKVFFSDSLPAPYSSVSQYVKDILSEYQSAAGKNFSYEFFDMDKAENQSLARNYGLQQVQIREVKNNEIGVKNVYMGLVFTYADQIEKLDSVTSSDGLEYKITTTVSRIISATNALSGLKEKVRLTLYKTGRLSDFNISGFNEIDGAVQSAYEAVSKKFQGRVVYESVEPVSSEVEMLAQRYGIQALSWKDADGNVQYGALGLVAELGDTFRVVPLEMVNFIFGYAVQGLDDLQNTITESIQGLVSKTGAVAYVTNHGELASTDAQYGAGNFAGLMGDSYTFKDIDLSQEEIPAGVQSVIINGPKSEFSEMELYKIDQFLMKGGNVMLFLDPYNEIEPEGQMAYYSQPEYVENRTGLEKLLSKYGITAQSAYVLDERCYSTVTQQYGRLNYYYAPQLQKRQLDQSHPVTRNLGYVLFLQPGALDVTEARKNTDVKVSVLAQSSEKSWTMEKNILLSPLAMTAPSDKSTEKPYNLAVIVEGRFQSAFEKAPSAAGSNEASAVSVMSHVAKSTQRGKLFVAGTSYITGPQVLQQGSTEPVALFLQNAVDYMNGNGDLCAMRTKGLSLNALAVTQGPFVNAVKYFNIFGLSVLVAFAGLLVLLSRRKRRNAIRMQYNPHDARETVTPRG